MTEREGAIIMAYTGIIFGSLTYFHKYAQKLLGRSIFTHEFADKKIMKEIKQKSKNDFLELSAEIMANEILKKWRIYLMNWISLDDQVPENMKKVLVFIKNESFNEITMGYRKVYKNLKVRWMILYGNQITFADKL